MNTKINFAGIEMKNPVTVASGTFGYGREYAEKLKAIDASISKKIIDLLIKEMKFNGVIITDDMEMNGIKGFTRLEACIKAINAGINMFIFRDTTKDIVELIEKLEKAVIEGIIPEEKIENSFDKIINLKRQYGIIR